MRELLLEFAQSGALMGMMLVIFCVGFLLKVLAGWCYDNALDNIPYISAAKSGIVKELKEKYEMDLKSGKRIRNTKVYVDNALHHWKKCGLKVEKMELTGELAGGIGLVICAFFDMLFLTQKTFEAAETSGLMRYVYVYTTLSVIFFLVIKSWSLVTDTNGKRKILSDAITDYFDNQMEYMEGYVSLKESIITDTSEMLVKENEVNEPTANKTSAINGTISNQMGENQNRKNKNSEKPNGKNKNSEKQNGENQNRKSKNGENQNGTESSGEKADKEKQNKKDGGMDKELVITQVLDEFLV